MSQTGAPVRKTTREARRNRKLDLVLCAGLLKNLMGEKMARMPERDLLAEIRGVMLGCCGNQRVSIPLGPSKVKHFSEGPTAAKDPDVQQPDDPQFLPRRLVD